MEARTEARTGNGVPIKVLSVASEMYPLVKTGGLADVVGALPAALAPFDVEMRTLLPGYPAVLAPLRDTRTLAQSPAKPSVATCGSPHIVAKS